MTLEELVKHQPEVIRNLAKDESVTDLKSLRKHVQRELQAYYEGRNAITEAQVGTLHNFLDEIRHIHW